MAGFRKFQVEKICRMSVRVEKKSVPGIVFSKKRFVCIDFSLNGLVNSRCDH